MYLVFLQTKSSNDMGLSKGASSNEVTPEPGAMNDSKSTDICTRFAGIEVLGIRSAYDNSLGSTSSGIFTSPTCVNILQPYVVQRVAQIWHGSHQL